MHKNEFANSIGLNGPDINSVRYKVVSDEFKSNKGKRTIIFLAQFPFLIIGPIKDVVGDYLLIEAEVTNVTELDGELFTVHIDEIEVYYIERKGRKIPDIRVKNHD
jgi:uncharacterized surface protein with fasciclin (FAS1) repeats